jgi:hypothetical protein
VLIFLKRRSEARRYISDALANKYNTTTKDKEKKNRGKIQGVV